MIADGSPLYLGLARLIKDDGVWFCRQPIGKNKLSSFARAMCDDGSIQGRKTNHSVRKTTVTALVHENIPDSRIMQLSGHSNVQSINSHSTASINQQKEMSNILNKIGTGKAVNTNEKPTDSIAVVEIPSDNEAELLSASQEAELNCVLKDITQYETNSGHVQASVSTAEIIPDNYKGIPFQMFALAQQSWEMSQ